MIRRIRPDDGPLLRQMRLRALSESPEAFAGTFADEQRRPASHWAAIAAQGARGDDRVTFLAFDGDECVGIVGGYRPEERPSERQLVSLWVAPEARGEGLGAELTRCVVDWARAGRASTVALWVVETNEAAHRAYLDLGFVPTDKTQALPSDACSTERYMELALSR